MATSAKRKRVPADRWFFGGMALAILGLTFGGFAPSFFLRGIVEPPAPLRPLSFSAVLHGVAATAWLALFAAQVILVYFKRTDIHRRLAGLGLALTAGVVLTGIAVSLETARLAAADERAVASILTSIPEFLLFLVLVLLALKERRRPQTHKRLILFAAISALPPAIARLGFDLPFSGLMNSYLSTLPLMLAIALWDFARVGKLHNGTLLGAGVMVAFWGSNILISQTSGWSAFAGFVARALANL